MYGRAFLTYTVAGEIKTTNGTKVGDLSSTDFMKIALTVDSAEGTYEITIDGVKVDEGAFTFKETSGFRPVQFNASGSSTLYLDYVKAYTVTEN